MADLFMSVIQREISLTDTYRSPFKQEGYVRHTHKKRL